MTRQSSGSRDQNHPTQEPQRPPLPKQQAPERTVELFGRTYTNAGLATIAIVIGAILFVFPEPITSAAGLLLVVGGAAAWLFDWLG